MTYSSDGHVIEPYCTDANLDNEPPGPVHKGHKRRHMLRALIIQHLKIV